MNRSDSIANLAKALAAVQAEMQPAINNSKNPFFNSDYADFEAVKAAAQPHLAKNGLSVIHVPWVTDGKMYLECVVLHSSGEWLSGNYPVNPVKNDPQSVGSAVTYAKRYSFSAMVGVVTKDDDDGNAATKPGAKPNQSAPRTNAPPPTRAGDNMRRDGSERQPQGPPAQPATAPRNNPAMNQALAKGPTESQMKRLYAIAASKKYTADGVHVYLESTFKIKSVKELNRQQYDDACNYFLNEPVSNDEVPF